MARAVARSSAAAVHTPRAPASDPPAVLFVDDCGAPRDARSCNSAAVEPRQGLISGGSPGCRGVGG
jgi:hypothetical protein